MFVQLGYRSFEETRKLSESYGKAVVFVENTGFIKAAANFPDGCGAAFVVSVSSVDDIGLERPSIIVVYPEEEHRLKGLSLIHI